MENTDPILNSLDNRMEPDVTGNDVYLTQFSEKDMDGVVTCINIAYSETMAIFKNIHIRRTSCEQLEMELKEKSSEIWGYRSKSGEVVATVIIRSINRNKGSVELLSVLPEYMGLGLSSALLRHSEYILHELGKKTMRMRVFLPNDFDVRNFEHLGYSVVAVDQWKEMENVLRPEAFDTWVWVTLEKSIGIASKSANVK